MDQNSAMIVWMKSIKIYPLRTLLKTSKGPDFVIALNYSEKFYFGIGLSIGVRGIYR